MNDTEACFGKRQDKNRPICELADDDLYGCVGRVEVISHILQILGDIMIPIEDYFDYVLEDDDSPYGGTAFSGETVVDFLLSIGSEYAGTINTVEQLNDELVGRGIKPIGV